MHEATKDYLRQIGRRGGKKSGRRLKGNRAKMAELGRKGGCASSPAKTAAAKLANLKRWSAARQAKALAAESLDEISQDEKNI